MNLIEPIIQSYIYTDVYNSSGGTVIAGVPVSKLLESEATQNGGAKTRFGDRLSVPAGLILIEEPYKPIRPHSTTNCSVVPDDLFDELVNLASVSHSRNRRQTESKRTKKGSRKTKRLDNTEKYSPKQK